MKKLILFGALGATLLGGGLVAAQTVRDADWTRADAVARADARFAKLDTNSDGKITPEERAARKDDRVEQRFAKMDADKNGAITLAEMKAAQAQREEMRGERKAGGHGGGGQEGGGRHGMRGGHDGRGGMDARVDANHDGTITKVEFEAPALAMFDRLDADKNGVVTKAERDAARATWKERRER